MTDYSTRSWGGFVETARSLGGEMSNWETGYFHHPTQLKLNGAAPALAAMRFALIAALMTMVSFSGFANSLIGGGYWEAVRLLAQSTCKLFHIPLALRWLGD